MSVSQLFNPLPLTINYIGDAGSVCTFSNAYYSQYVEPCQLYRHTVYQCTKEHSCRCLPGTAAPTTTKTTPPVTTTVVPPPSSTVVPPPVTSAPSGGSGSATGLNGKFTSHGKKFWVRLIRLEQSIGDNNQWPPIRAPALTPEPSASLVPSSHLTT